MDGKSTKIEYRILLCFTGSVATIKDSELVGRVREALPSASLRLVFSGSARRFSTLFRQKVPDAPPIFVDEDELTWSEKGDPVLHIELSKWADLIVIAPLSANSLAQISAGLCPTIIPLILRALPFSQGKYAKRVLFAPAMNSSMWAHPVTTEHLDRVKTWGAEVIPPVEKKLACGDFGIGAMASVEEIVRAIAKEHQAFVERSNKV